MSDKEFWMDGGWKDGCRPGGFVYGIGRGMNADKLCMTMIKHARRQVGEYQKQRLKIRHL